MTDDLTWIEKSVEQRARYLMHGMHAGQPATAWDDYNEFDSLPEVVATQITTITSGTVLGAHPDLGRVTMTQDLTTTEVRIVEEGPVIFDPKRESERP